MGTWRPSGLHIRPESRCFPVEGEATTASLVEPLSCVLHSLSRARLAPGEWVAVFGLGVMGALHVLAATAFGLPVAWISLAGSPVPTRRLASAEIELWNVPAADVPPPALKRERVSPRAAFCIRGGADAFSVACSIVRPGGMIVNFASPVAKSVLAVEMAKMRATEVSICASVNHTLADFAKAAALSGKISGKLKNLIAELYPLASIELAMQRAVGTDSGRIIVQPSNMEETE